MNSTSMEGPSTGSTEVLTPAEKAETELIKTEARLSGEVSDVKKTNDALKRLIKHLEN